MPGVPCAGAPGIITVSTVSIVSTADPAASRAGDGGSAGSDHWCFLTSALKALATMASVLAAQDWHGGAERVGELVTDLAIEDRAAEVRGEAARLLRGLLPEAQEGLSAGSHAVSWWA